MHKIKLENCNNIKNGEIAIAPHKLNIKYGINGVGKSSLANAINNSKDIETLSSFKSYFATEEESILIDISPEFNKVLVFDEQFVNNIVFIENSVIENSFEVFIKTANYDVKKAKLDERLKSLKETVVTNSDMLNFNNKLKETLGKFQKTQTGLKKTGAMKSILSKQNLYNLPSDLAVYQKFFEDENNNINWIDWKSKGDQFDVHDNCPYCAEKIDKPTHETRKEIFKKTYKKADSQHLKSMLDLIESLANHLTDEKFSMLNKYIKTDTDEATIHSTFSKFVSEIELIVSKLEIIADFGEKKIIDADVNNLDEEIRKMRIPIDTFDYIISDTTKTIFENINSQVEEMLKELNSIKSDLGALKGLLMATVKACNSDINDFLKSAGIQYKLEINYQDESNSKTILKQCFSDNESQVTNIRKHLSWGEKNAFSLILFMYYAKAQNPELIILDDPISSFDTNKKYAIFHRMFKKNDNNVSFEGNTVLLLTHDFQPITDFIAVGKLSPEKANASFLWNDDKTLKEQSIIPDQDIILIMKQCEKRAKDENLNIISRAVALRKLCELNDKSEDWAKAYEILSCLIHGTEIRRKIVDDTYKTMSPEEIEQGTKKIKLYIHNFDYNQLLSSSFCESEAARLYFAESNKYNKLQIFRTIYATGNELKKSIDQSDAAWFKFIDETYHIENDNLYYLDVSKFNIVPFYVSKKVDELMSRLEGKI